MSTLKFTKKGIWIHHIAHDIQIGQDIFVGMLIKGPTWKNTNSMSVACWQKVLKV